MRIPASKNFLAAIVVTCAIVLASAAQAQFGMMGMPLPTTVIVEKPGPGEIYGNKQVVTMGVGAKIYKFILKDAYVDDPNNRIRWPDVWQLVRQYRPNFKVTGVDANVFDKIEPGQTMTIHGMFAALGQNFEVTSSELGGGVFAPPSHY
ncbi:MAG: hypothetical protein Q7S58_19115 [Candidatus Binatus sp.]|uniref:hypothetical protein n=1 Tax=Candidatus Binatus sp. TaxID=2811406 RepID=UPI002724A4A2|nr:hypothetical protein [Candidatus Binatus sp.]MDO8434512.1 hypothetical protein [Candidatus Binatus sp.]